MIKQALYTATAHTTGGRTGTSATPDGRLKVTLDTPKAMGGNDGPGTNPEQLFAAGYSACFGSALAVVARMQKIQTGPVSITANVTLGSVGQGYGLAVELVAHLPNLPREQAEALVHAAHQVCPYSNATRGNIEVQVTLV